MIRAVIPELEKRHHTEAQIAAKKAKAAKTNNARDVPAPDEFGPWDTTEDEFGSWVDKRDIKARGPHHTEAQVAAKKAKAAKAAKGKAVRAVPPPDEFGPWDTTEDEFGSWVDKREVETREPHHTEAQVRPRMHSWGLLLTILVDSCQEGKSRQDEKCKGCARAR